MINRIRNPLLRKSVVVFTVIGTVTLLAPIWLYEAVRDKLRRDFGEDIADAWRGRR